MGSSRAIAGSGRATASDRGIWPGDADDVGIWPGQGWWLRKEYFGGAFSLFQVYLFIYLFIFILGFNEKSDEKQTNDS